MKTTIQKAKENKAELDQEFWVGSHHLLNINVKHASNVEKFSMEHLVYDEDHSNSDVLAPHVNNIPDKIRPLNICSILIMGNTLEYAAHVYNTTKTGTKFGA
jgi:hypothetical protein